MNAVQEDILEYDYFVVYYLPLKPVPLEIALIQCAIISKFEGRIRLVHVIRSCKGPNVVRPALS